jgi:hypothetical protein
LDKTSAAIFMVGESDQRHAICGREGGAALIRATILIASFVAKSLSSLPVWASLSSVSVCTVLQWLSVPDVGYVAQSV